MPILSGGVIIEGSYGQRIFGAAPGAGTDEVQTLTIGGTPTGGTFTLSFMGFTTAAIPWSAVNATLLASINAALDALPNVAAGEILAAAGSLTAGIGTITLTFSGEWGKRAVGPIVAVSSLTGTAPTAVVADTTPGVDADGRGAPKGTLAVDSATGIWYSNIGTSLAPNWQKVGLQS